MESLGSWVEAHKDEGALVQLRQLLVWIDQFHDLIHDRGGLQGLLECKTLAADLSGLASRAILLAIYAIDEMPGSDVATHEGEQLKAKAPKRRRRKAATA